MNVLDENIIESQIQLLRSWRIVSLTVGQNEVASFIRRFLKHPAFRNQSKRKGKVVVVILPADNASAHRFDHPRSSNTNISYQPTSGAKH